MRTLSFWPWEVAASAPLSLAAQPQPRMVSTRTFHRRSRLRGFTQSFHSKILQLDTNGPALLEQRDLGPPEIYATEEFYKLIAPQVAKQRSAIAFTGSRPCGGGSGCVSGQTAQGTVTESAGHEILRAFGSSNTSPVDNTRCFSRNTLFGIVSPAELVDFNSGTHVEVLYLFYARRGRRIADDGTVAIFHPGSILLWRLTVRRRPVVRASDCILHRLANYFSSSDDAERVVYGHSGGVTAGSIAPLTVAYRNSISPQHCRWRVG
jgi:hypothetical protein